MLYVFVRDIATPSFSIIHWVRVAPTSRGSEGHNVGIIDKREFKKASIGTLFFSIAGAEGGAHLNILSIGCEL